MKPHAGGCRVEPAHRPEQVPCHARAEHDVGPVVDRPDLDVLGAIDEVATAVERDRDGAEHPGTPHNIPRNRSSTPEFGTATAPASRALRSSSARTCDPNASTGSPRATNPRIRAA